MSEQTEREVIEALWVTVKGEPPVAGDWQTGADFDQFTAMLDAGAYFDAALMLVPEGWAYILDTTGLFSSVSLWNGQHCVIGEYFDGVSIKRSTPALAICAAIEAAIAREDTP